MTNFKEGITATALNNILMALKEADALMLQNIETNETIKGSEAIELIYFELDSLFNNILDEIVEEYANKIYDGDSLIKKSEGIDILKQIIQSKKGE